MGAAALRLSVMRSELPHDPPRHRDPAYTRGVGASLLASALLALAIVVTVVALSYPTLTAGTAVLAAAALLTARTARRARRTRRRTGRITVCVPKTGLCVQV